MEDSIFTKIINGDLPCHKIYEDEKIFAFLDINPISDGHTLVVPKKQVEFVWDLDDEDYLALMSVCKKIAKSHRQKLGVKYVGVKIVGTDVPHTHVHIVPFNNVANEFHRTTPAEETDHDKLAKLAEKLHLS